MKITPYLITVIGAFNFLLSCQAQPETKEDLTKIEKVNGVSLVSPPSIIPRSGVASVKEVSANWVAIIPYAFSPGHKPEVYFDSDRQWWGERPEGVQKLIQYAQSEGLKIMLKPHVWVLGDGWTGDFELNTEQAWKAWEKAYADYIITYANMAQKYKVELFCIGTEYRKVVQQRGEFWPRLADQVQQIYDGPITYAANWDNLESIGFWSSFDYIGVDGYFPLSNVQTPSVAVLVKAWEPIKDSLQQISQDYGKPILFTEYGYKSCDYATGAHWETNEKQAAFNTLVQQNGYNALFDVFWKQEWFAGGFLWKWYPYQDSQYEESNTEFTPQGKPVIEDIKRRYELFKNEAMTEIKIGDKIPDITLTDQYGQKHALAEYIGQPVVIYFYPKDDTPGCTLEACSFRDQYQDFKDLGAEVVGISKDTPQSHFKFAEKYDLGFTLLSDSAGLATSAFGVPRKFFGLTPGRVTYVFNAKGALIKKFNSAIQMKKHVSEALEALRKK